MTSAYRVSDLTLSRLGYGAMQLAGPHVFGPPADRDAAIAVLRTACELGINHIDTADYYGPHVTNEIIRDALYPYPSDLTIITKVGSVRDDESNWLVALSPSQLVAQVHDNLRSLGVDALDVVNLRVGGFDTPDPSVSLAPQFEALASLRSEGLIRHLGLSTVTAGQLAEAQAIAPVVTVQNMFNVARREDQAMVDVTASQGIAYVPYFPLGGFSPLQSETLTVIAKSLSESPLAVALAWLIHRSPNILPIPGTSSVAHLRENVAAAKLELSDDVLRELNALT